MTSPETNPSIHRVNSCSLIPSFGQETGAVPAYPLATPTGQPNFMNAAPFTNKVQAPMFSATTQPDAANLTGPGVSTQARTSFNEILAAMERSLERTVNMFATVQKKMMRESPGTLPGQMPTTAQPSMTENGNPSNPL